MSLRVFIQGSEHDGQDDLDVVTDKVAEVLIVPEVKGTLGNLEVRTGNGLNKGSWTFANSAGSMTSKISSTSFRNMTSLVLFTFGQ
jgi:hypothetical protein